MRVHWLCVIVALAGCGAKAASGPLVPAMPTVDAGCRLGSSANSVLVTEWASSEKANLQAMLRGGAVAVAFSGCEMRLMPQCKLGGQYYWQRTTVASDRIDISNEAELYAKLPLGAISLGGELKKSGTLAVETTVSGQVRLYDMDAPNVPADPSCGDATHIINAVSIGAFTLSAGGTEGTKGNATVKGLGANGKLEQTAKIVRGGGDRSTCVNATDQDPAFDCSSPLQAFLTRIPGRGEAEAPVGTVAVDFVSASPSTRWEVAIDDQVTCTTPCSAYVDPSRPISLRSVGDQESLQVDSVLAGVGPVQIAATPRNGARFATGISFLGVAGATAVIGGFFVLLAGDDREGMATAGKVTAASSLLLAPIGLYLLLTSGARVDQRARFGTHGAVIRF